MQTTFDIANEIFQQVFGYKPFNQTVIRVYEPECEETPFYEANVPAVKQVIFNKNATIVYFVDGSKCVVHKSKIDEYNREHAVVYAIVKRAYGTVNADGTVDGNGMGNMLAKVVANGYDQEAHDEAEKAKKEAKSTNVNDEKYAWGYQPVQNWTDANCPKRDERGRFVKCDKYSPFVKKANRK